MKVLVLHVMFFLQYALEILQNKHLGSWRASCLDFGNSYNAFALQAVFYHSKIPLEEDIFDTLIFFQMKSEGLHRNG